MASLALVVSARPGHRQIVRGRGLRLPCLYADKQFCTIPILRALQSQPFAAIVAVPRKGKTGGVNALCRGQKSQALSRAAFGCQAQAWLCGLVGAPTLTAPSPVASFPRTGSELGHPLARFSARLWPSRHGHFRESIFATAPAPGAISLFRVLRIVSDGTGHSRRDSWR